MYQNQYVKKKSTINEIFNNDKDTINLYYKISELLIAAGYFRARIQNLEPFDKILGGLAWTLTGCYYDIDIDFKDDMSLAEKIHVSEKIVAGLSSIKCPINLNPVQIQGLDLPAIYNTLQWVVKRLLETRDERNLLNKNFSLDYLNSKFPTKPVEISKDDDQIINTKYSLLKPNRKFRPKNKLGFEYNDEIRVYFGMIEFGLNKEISFQKQLIELLRKKSLISNEGEDKNKNKQKVPGPKDQKLTKEEMKILNEMVNSNVEEINKGNEKVNKNMIEAIFSENMAEIAKEIDKFDNSKGEEGIDRIKLIVKEKERLEQNKLNLLEQMKGYQNEYEGKVNENNQEQEEINKIIEDINQLKAMLEQNNKNKELIDQKVKDEQLSEEKLQFLSEKNKEKEELKLAITKFKKDCLNEKKQYDAQLDNYEKKIDKMNNEENLQLFNEIDINYNEELEKNLEIKKKLFERNKEINRLTRKIQLCPSKLEMIQYQKRFNELYDQMNNVSEKSRKILGEVNSKVGVVELLERRYKDYVDLKTIYKNINPKHKREKEDFKATLTNANNSLLDSVNHASKKLSEINKNIESEQKNLNDLQLYELNYMKLVKEYNKQYNKYNAINK